MGALKYRIGLDLGTTSLGWCLIRLDSEDRPCAIIKTGVRIFSDGRNPKDKTSLAVVRRNARQARRRRDRFLRRKEKLIAALIDLEFFPKDDQSRKQLVSLNPYKLRKKGLDHELSPGEFARAIFHLNQRRGFKSNRKIDSKDNEFGVMKSSISQTQIEIEESDCRTLGEWLASRHAAGKSVRARLRGKTVKEKRYDYYADRSMLEQEFNALWDAQAKFGNKIYSSSAYQKLVDIIFFQRPLRAVSPGRCALLPDEYRAQLALPSSQQFRIYQEVNNLRILNKDFTETSPLEKRTRDAIAAHLQSGKNAKFDTVIRKLCHAPAGSRFNLQEGRRDELKGNITSKLLSRKNAFGPKWNKLELETQDKIVHMLISEPDEILLQQWLIENTGVGADAAEAIANTQLPEGYGNLSEAAISKILEKLKSDVVTYAEAAKRAGFASHSALSAAEQTGIVASELPYYGECLQRHVAFGSNIEDDPDEIRFGKIANPTVHIGLNQLRIVVNAIIKKYGKPEQIIIEVARDLKLGEKRKREITKLQNERRQKNEQVLAEACDVLGLDQDILDSSKRRDLVQRMTLWTELNPTDIANRRCPFSGKQISIGRLFSSEVEIEHIFPFSRTLDDSLANKTLAFREANRLKDRSTPFEAFGSDRYDGYVYSEILERASLLPRAKARRFAPDGYENWMREHSDFLARALNDTAYLSRLAREYVSVVCPWNQVHVVPGRLTALLRAKWGLNGVISGSTKKNRNDHRHHAIDAFVVGIADRKMLRRVAKASSHCEKGKLDRLISNMPYPWGSYLNDVQRSIQALVVSHRPDHGYQGQIMQETAYGPRPEGLAFERKFDENTGQRVSVISKKKLEFISGADNVERHGADTNGIPRDYKGYVSGNNYCVEIVSDEKGKWEAEIVPRRLAYLQIQKHGISGGLKRLRDPKQSLSGKDLVMRLMINDTISVNGDCGREVYRVQKIKSSGDLYFAPVNEANADARDRKKDDPFKFMCKRANPLSLIGARAVTVSPLGKVRFI